MSYSLEPKLFNVREQRSQVFHKPRVGGEEQHRKRIKTQEVRLMLITSGSSHKGVDRLQMEKKKRGVCIQEGWDHLQRLPLDRCSFAESGVFGVTPTPDDWTAADWFYICVLIVLH